MQSASLIAVATLLLSQNVALTSDAPPPEPHLPPLNEVIAGVKELVGAERLCDKALERQQRYRFNQLYGKAIKRLIVTYESWHGPDEPLFQLGNCWDSKDKIKMREGLDRQMALFAGQLAKLEREYSRPTDGYTNKVWK